jgi:hypothetical protein
MAFKLPKIFKIKKLKTLRNEILFNSKEIDAKKICLFLLSN